MKIYREDPAFEMTSDFLSPEVYAAAITSFVIVCSDTMIINKARKTVFLATRAVKPMQGLWIIGGRRLAGEPALKGAQRTFARETGLTIEPERFRLLDTYELIWKDRQQHPQNAGSHNISSTFAVELTDAEISSANRALDRMEYQPGGLREFTRGQLVEAGAFPALLDLYDLAFPRKWWQRIFSV